MKENYSPLRSRVNRALVEIGSVFHFPGIEEFATEAVARGDINPGVIWKSFGFQAFTDLEPSLSTAYLRERIEEGHGFTTRKLLVDLGIKKGFGVGQVSIETDVAMVPWLSLIAQAIKQSRLTEIDYQRAEEFFANFPFKEAMPQLISLLNNDVHISQQQIDPQVKPLEETVVRTVKEEVEGEPHDYPGGWPGEWKYDTYALVEVYEVQVVEAVYPAYYPIAEGAKVSLLRIRESNSEHAEIIDKTIIEYNSQPKVCTVEYTRRVSNTPIRSYTTHH